MGPYEDRKLKPPNVNFISDLPAGSQWRKRRRVLVPFGHSSRAAAHSRHAFAAHARLCVRRIGTALCGVSLVCAVAARVEAAPSLRVRAHVQLELHTLGSESGARIAGSLRDDLGAPLAGRELLLSAENPDRTRPRPRTLRTDAEGKFDAPSPCGPESACRISLELEGDAFYEHAQVSHLVEPQKAEVRLQLSEPSALALDLDRVETRVVVQASSALGGAGLLVTLEDELGRKLASGNTADDGRATFDVPSATLGGAGLGELIASTPGDAARTAARSGKAVLRTLGTRVELDAKFDAEARSLQLAVRLNTQRGPIAQRAVGVFAGQQHVATLITDARGAAARSASVDALGLAEGKQQLTARFASDLPGLGASESRAVPISIEPAPRPNSLWLALPALASIAFAWWSARRRQLGAAGPEAVALREPEVRLGAAARGRGPLFTCSGRVEDAESSAPIEALLELEHESGAPSAVHAGQDGRFESDTLAPGKYRVRVLAQGYASIAFELDVPHHGTGSDLRIALRSLRALALDTYAAVLGRAVSEPRAQASTVREALTAAVSGGRGGVGVRDLAHATERIAYARPIPFESDLLELQRAAASAVRELDDHSPAPKDPELGR